jgi:predicted CXXCH cytochrome family protein
MTPSLLISETCPYCAKPRPVSDILPFGGTTICTSCYQAHLAALWALTNAAPPNECSECHLTYRQLLENAGVVDNQPHSMDCHYENGAYRFLCKKCSAAYVRKRRELYGNTEFGNKLKLR